MEGGEGREGGERKEGVRLFPSEEIIKLGAYVCAGGAAAGGEVLPSTQSLLHY